MSYRYEDDYEEVPVKRQRPKTASSSAKRGGEAPARKAPAAQRPVGAQRAPAKRPQSARDEAQPVRKRTVPAQRPRDYDDPYRPAPKRPAAYKKARKKRTNPMVALVGWLLAIALAFGISYFVREYGFEIIRVSGDGMYETLMDGDLALVTKYDYKNGAPAKGDVVAVEMGGRKGVILRRVVAQPGETIEIVSGETFIDGTKVLEQYIGLQNYDTFEGRTLPPGKYYLLGDNRTELGDSRNAQIGLIDQQDIVGKVRWIIWPLNHLGSL